MTRAARAGARRARSGPVRCGAARATRGGWHPTGTSAERRASSSAAPGAKAQRSREKLLAAARRMCTATRPTEHARSPR